MRRPLNENVFVIAIFVVLALALVSRWDEEDLASLQATAAKIAVENSLRREYFASDFHCRAPRKGERLLMQHAALGEPGKGYRCTYVILSPLEPGPRRATITWSRSPDVVLNGYLGRNR